MVPVGRVQVQNNKVSAGLDIVRHLRPLWLVPVKILPSVIMHKFYIRLDRKPLFVFNDEVEHGATTVQPGSQVQSDAVGGDLDEPGGLGNHRLGALGPRVQVVRALASSNSYKN